MGKYQAYPEYKDSGVDFLDELPSGWGVLRGKYVFSEFSERSTTGEELLLSVSEYYGVKPRGEVIEDGDHLSRAESLVDYKKCSVNDLVMNIMLAWKCGLGVTKYEGIVSPAYSVFRFGAGASPDYMHYLLRTPTYTGFFKTRSTGVIDSRLRLYPESFGNVPIVIPPEREQISIANFLDHETAKIDTLIEKQQQLIQLLKEKRQAVISHAVTKGLNPNAPMKDSGVEWLGEVPEHWVICCLKHVVSKVKDAMVDGPFGSSVNTDTDYVDDGVPVIRTVNITNMGFSSENLKYMRVEKFEQLKRHAVYPGDILFSKVGTIGNSCILPQSISHAILSTTGSCKITIDYSMCIAQYLVFSIQLMNQDLMQIANSNVQPFLNMTNIKNLKIVLPPMNEQVSILNHLDKNIKKIDDVINQGVLAEALLLERRTALISAAVTGKIDVRSWQAPQN